MPPKKVTTKKVTKKASKPKVSEKPVTSPAPATSKAPVTPPEPPKPVVLEKAIKLKQLATIFDDESIGAKPVILAETAGTNMAGTFLRYRDVNYLSVLNSNEMEPERIRKAILGGLRFGKPVVFDTEDANMFDQVQQFINRVEPDLFKNILNATITNSKKKRKRKNMR